MVRPRARKETTDSTWNTVFRTLSIGSTRNAVGRGENKPIELEKIGEFVGGAVADERSSAVRCEPAEDSPPAAAVRHHLRWPFEPEWFERLANTLLAWDLVERLPAPVARSTDRHLRPPRRKQSREPVSSRPERSAG